MAEEKIIFQVEVDSKAAEGSLEALGAQAKLLKKQLDLEKAGTDQFNKLAQELASVENEISGVTESVKDFAKAFDEVPAEPLANSIAGLTKEADRLREEFNEVERGTPEFEQLGRALQKVEAEIKDVELQFEALDFEQRLTAGTDALVGVAGGFAAAEGAAALFGAESEALEQTLSKVAGALALSSGIRDLGAGVVAIQKLNIVQTLNNKLTKVAATVQKLWGGSIQQNTKAFGRLKGAIAATGIGALVVLIGAAIANWDKITEALGFATDAQLKNNEASLAAADAVSEELSALDALENKLADETLSREEKNKAIEALQDEYPALLFNIDAETASLEEVNKAIELNGKLIFERAKLEALAALRSEEIKKQLEEQIKAQTGANVGAQSYAVSLANLVGGFEELSTVQGAANAQTAATIKETEGAIDVIDEITRATEDNIAAIEAQGGVGQKEFDAQQERDKQRKSALDKRKKDDEDESKRQLNTLKLLAKENEERNLERLEVLGKTLQDESDIRKLASAQLATNIEQDQVRLDAIDQAASAARIKRIKEEAAERDAARQEQLNNAQGGLDLLNAANDAFVKDEAKREKIKKKLAVAQIAIDTARAVSSAIAAGAGIPFPGNIPAILSGVTAVLTGIAQAKALLGQSQSTSVDIGGATGGSGGGQLNQISNTATLIDQDQQEITQQVVVVESDITNAQNNVNVIESGATF